MASASHIDDLTLTVHPHPTLPESIEEAAEQVEQHAIHIFNVPEKFERAEILEQVLTVAGGQSRTTQVTRS